MELSAVDRVELERAVRQIEQPGLAARAVSTIGLPMESAIQSLPAAAHGAIERASMRALERATDVAVRSLGTGGGGEPSTGRHRWAATACGAVGGWFGLPGLLVELPASTVVMLRSIAEIARAEGEDLNDVSARLACVECFALGSRSFANDGPGGYFAVRGALGAATTQAIRHIGRFGMLDQGAPVIVRLLAAIAARFQIVVAEKAALQTVPIVGGFGGAAINNVFIGYFQRIAHGHFTIRRLERRYGEEAVREAYDRIRGRERVGGEHAGEGR